MGGGGKEKRNRQRPRMRFVSGRSSCLLFSLKSNLLLKFSLSIGLSWFSVPQTPKLHGTAGGVFNGCMCCTCKNLQRRMHDPEDGRG